MSIISFAQTTGALLEGRKTVTRRDWTDRHAKQWVKAWNEGRKRHHAWDKTPRCKGSKQVGWIVLTEAPYQEPLKDMPESDLEAEGGYWDSLDDFFAGESREKLYWVVRFTFEPLAVSSDDQP